jgi:hypothetical protein
MSTPKRKVTIPAGADWQDVVSIFEGPFVYHDIVSVQRGWPTQIEVAAHGLPDGITGLAWIQGASKLGIDTEANAPHAVKRVDADTLEILGFSTIGKPAYTGGGRVALLTCASLTGATARVQFKTAVDADPIVTLTEASGITIASRTMTIALTPAQGRLLLGGSTTPVSGEAQVELTRSSVVSRPFSYAWTVAPEWTKEP